MRTPRKFYSNSSFKSMSNFIYYQKLLSRFNSRRSPRFATSIRNGAARSSGSLNWSELKMWDERTLRRWTKKLKSMHASDLTRFPSLGSASVAEMHLHNAGSGSGISGKSRTNKAKSCLGKCESRNSGKKSLSRCSRFSAAITGAEKVVRTISDAGKQQGYRGQELELNAVSEDHGTILVGKCLEENSFRSPRLSSTKFDCEFSISNGSSQKMLEFHGKSCLRVKSRNNSNLRSDAKTCLVSQHNDTDKGTASFKHCDVNFIGEKQLRKSPRLNSSTRGHDREASTKGLDVKSFDGMEFRRSPRFLSSSGNQNLKIFQKGETSKERRSSKVNIKYSKSAVEQHLKVATASGYSSPSITGGKRSRCSAETIGSPSGIENDKIACNSFVLPESAARPPRKNFKASVSSLNKSNSQKSISFFIGDPIPYDEAQKRWGWRYELKQKNAEDQSHRINDDEEDKIIVNVECHYAQAKVGNCIYNLEDCAYIEGEEGRKHVGKIVEFFQTTEKQNYFRVQWFYRIEDTVFLNEGGFHDKRRLFYSTIMDDNLIDCIIAKANVTHTTPRVDLKLNSISSSDFYYDMEYCVDYSTFRSKPTHTKKNVTSSCKTELTLLDLYSGCGGMSTGLCLGAKVSSVDLVTRWAVDSHRSACESFQLNHPQTHVRNASAEEFLELLKEWKKLCVRYKVNEGDRTRQLLSKSSGTRKKQVNSDEIRDGEYEVSRLVDICYGDPNETGKSGLYFKVHWKGYSSREDTWEQIKDLGNCQERVQDFVRNGMKSNILPLPGDVDVICGGPPCQGISGYNRFRNTTSPLDDERNRQIVVFMDIVKFLKPKYVLMENVVDILKFDKASLARYALSCLVHMNYQARLGTIAAGCYGLPQFRLRVFLWGAHPDEVLPQFPLPTHETIVKYWPPLKFERNTVAYDEGQPRKLENTIVIQDAISDLPAVTNYETREEMPYENPPETEFQRYIRSTKYEMTGSTLKGKAEKKPLLYDHRPCSMHQDDYLRVCQIPKRKGANFRDLPGVVVGADNVVQRDPKETPLLPSGKPMVPDYAIIFKQGKSKRPFARLWWDETVATVLTTPSCNTQAVLHPEQDRVLTIREFARMQGFPDYYRFSGTVKERYCQIGNAVAVSVSRALGYALGMAYRKLSGDEPLMTLPPKFSHSNYFQLSKQSSCPN